MLWYNLRERVLSKHHYNSMCLRMLAIQGYEVDTLQDDDRNKDRKTTKVHDEDYTDIGDIIIK